jgi:FixJ family two-component response regulator
MSNGPDLIATNSVVYVVDDDDSMRNALGRLFRSVGLGVELFGSAQEFLDFDKRDVPSCLILDVRLKGQSGLALQEQIVAGDLQLPIIFITAHGDVAMSVKAMKNGALDFMSKPFRDQDMLDVVQNALLKDEKRRKSDGRLADVRRRYGTLTPREREVMKYVVSGLLNKQIAAEMGLSEITVKIHRGHAMRKMGARTLPEFVLGAQALGLDPAAEYAAGRRACTRRCGGVSAAAYRFTICLGSTSVRPRPASRHTIMHDTGSAKLPDDCFSTPTTYGPKKPPMLPIALIHAMPLAALLGPSTAVGIPQNTGGTDSNPALAMHSASTVSHRLPCQTSASMSPAAASRNSAAVCRRRSR